jgi:hypothetical protein
MKKAFIILFVSCASVVAGVNSITVTGTTGKITLANGSGTITDPYLTTNVVVSWLLLSNSGTVTYPPLAKVATNGTAIISAGASDNSTYRWKAQ